MSRGGRGASSATTATAAPRERRPLIAHILYRFDFGGLENGLANLINRMPRSRYRHVVISLTEATSFRQRVRRDDVAFIDLHKPPGHGYKLMPRLFDVFRRLRPDVVHTRNLAALEATAPAWLARVPVRVHGEHGRDVGDLDGSNRAYRTVRRMYRPFVTHYVALSGELERYLVDAIGIPATRVTRIVNGVDLDAFMPAPGSERPSTCPFQDRSFWLCGTVGRLQPVKNQQLLAQAFARALSKAPELRSTMRLVIVGEGPALGDIRAVLDGAGIADLAWIPGARNDVADILRMLDVFVLPSLAEGISNTILEAMATGLPVVATDVGGNAELVDHGLTGVVVPSGDVDAMADALVSYATSRRAAREAGRDGRQRAERLYGLDTMVAHYEAMYERMLGGSHRGGVAPGTVDRLTAGSN